jgi:hypothetical protein
MNRRRALVLVVVITLLGIAIACGNNRVPVAEFDCVVSDAGENPHTCGAGQFCERMSCDAEVGHCVSIDSPGCENSGFECGCDGVTYFNQCLRLQARMTPQATPQGTGGQCPLFSQQARACGPGAPPPGCAPGQSCATILPSPDSIGMLLAIIAPDAGGLATQMLQDQCKRINDPKERFHFLEYPPAGVCWSLPDAQPPSSTSRLADFCGDCFSAYSLVKRQGLIFPCTADASDDD